MRVAYERVGLKEKWRVDARDGKQKVHSKGGNAQQTFLASNRQIIEQLVLEIVIEKFPEKFRIGFIPPVTGGLTFERISRFGRLEL